MRREKRVKQSNDDDNVMVLLKYRKKNYKLQIMIICRLIMWW